MNPNSSLQTSTDLRPPTTGHRPPSSVLHLPSFSPAFTLIELLVVISIIGLLAGLAVPAIGGAMKSAKKSEVAALTQSIRTAILAWNSEYGTWPTNGLWGGSGYFETGQNFFNMLATTNDPANNQRGIIFLEVPAKFLDDRSNIVTPASFIKGSRPMIRFQVDGTGSGSISNVGYENTNLRTAVAVWSQDPDKTNRSIGTWK